MNFLIFMIILSPFTALIPALYGGYQISKGNLKFKKNYWNMGIIALFLWAGLVAILNKSIFSFIASFLILGYFSISVIAENYFISRNRVRNVLKHIVKLSTICAVLAIGEKIIMLFYGNFTYRIYSTFGNPNMAGAWFASAFIISLYLRDRSLDRAEKKQLDFSLFVFLIAIVLSGSRGAYGSLISAIVVYFLLYQGENKKKRTFFALFVLTVSMLAIWSELRVSEALITHDISRSFTLRTDIWKGSFRMFMEKPITGWGLLGTLIYGDALIPEYGKIIHPHNLWLTFLTCTGVVGLFIYLFMKFNLIKDMIKLYNRREPLVPLLAALNVMLIIQGLIDCTLYAPQLGILFIATGSIVKNLEVGKIKNKNSNMKRINIEYVVKQKVV